MCLLDQVQFVPGSVHASVAEPLPGVIYAGKMWNENFPTLWPEDHAVSLPAEVGLMVPQASWGVSKEGSITAKMFCRMCREAWLERLSDDEKKAPKMLILDSLRRVLNPGILLL